MFSEIYSSTFSFWTKPCLFFPMANLNLQYACNITKQSGTYRQNEEGKSRIWFPFSPCKTGKSHCWQKTPICSGCQELLCLFGDVGSGKWENEREMRDKIIFLTQRNCYIRRTASRLGSRADCWLSWYLFWHHYGTSLFHEYKKSSLNPAFNEKHTHQFLCCSSKIQIKTIVLTNLIKFETKSKRRHSKCLR